MKEIRKEGGLRQRKEKTTDFLMGSIFGYPELPPDIDFDVSTFVKIKDQGNNDQCTAYAICAVSEDQEGVELNPDYTFAKTKQLSEGDIESWGATLEDAFKSACLPKGFGFISQTLFDNEGLGLSGIENLRDWKSWPKELDERAKEHAKESYFWIRDIGYDDMFDAIRAYLWKFKNKNQSVASGIFWSNEYTIAPNGIIDKIGKKSYGHAFKLKGQQFINGKPYIVCQLSNGENIGDKGIFYMSREIINTCKKFGAGMLVDLPRQEAEFLINKGLTIKWLWLAKLLMGLKKYFKEFYV